MMFDPVAERRERLEDFGQLEARRRPRRASTCPSSRRAGSRCAPSRVLPVAAVCASGVPAGTIDSRNGSAIVTPTPFRNVRRDRCFLRQECHASSSYGFFSSHLERRALDDAEDERREAMIVSAPSDVTIARTVGMSSGCIGRPRA